MIPISHLTLAVSIAASQPAPTTQEVLEARGGCYDVALVGKIVTTDGFEDLNDLLPPGDDSIWWGGISSVLVRKDIQVIGHSPKLGWIKVIMSAQPLPTTRILLLAKNHSSGIPIGVYWTTLQKGDASRQVAQALAHASVERCP